MRPQYRNGFSLIEVIVVVSLMALVMCMVTMQWSQPYQSAKIRFDVDQVIDFDSKTRRHAITVNRGGTLTFSLDERSVTGTRWAGGAARQLSINTSSARVRTIATSRGTQSTGTAQLSVTRSGATRTYAIEFSAPDYNQWVMVAGRTGQVTFMDSSNDVDEVLQQLRIEGAQ